jgi:hypothetical protein
LRPVRLWRVPPDLLVFVLTERAARMSHHSNGYMNRRCPIAREAGGGWICAFENRVRRRR